MRRNSLRYVPGDLTQFLRSSAVLNLAHLRHVLRVAAQGTKLGRDYMHRAAIVDAVIEIGAVLPVRPNV